MPPKNKHTELSAQDLQHAVLDVKRVHKVSNFHGRCARRKPLLSRKI